MSIRNGQTEWEKGIKISNFDLFFFISKFIDLGPVV